MWTRCPVWAGILYSMVQLTGVPVFFKGIVWHHSSSTFYLSKGKTVTKTPVNGKKRGGQLRMCLGGGICSSAERNSVGVDLPSSRQDVPDMLQPVGDRNRRENWKERHLSISTLFERHILTQF